MNSLKSLSINGYDGLQAGLNEHNQALVHSTMVDLSCVSPHSFELPLQKEKLDP